jgi:hypothetical protein
MKYILFILLTATAFAQDAMYNWAITNGDGTVIAVLVANQAVGATYPQSIQSIYPDALGAVQTNNAGMGWHYDSTTNTFTAPLAETIVDVSKAPPAFTLQDPTPVVLTTNNAVALPVVTTNNLSILTTNNSQ